MNRIQLPSWKLGSNKPHSTQFTNTSQSPHSSAPQGAHANSSEPTSFAAFGPADIDGEHSTEPLQYSLFGPLHYEPKYAYPLLVWLHGPRDDERQLQQIMPLVSLRNYVAIGPRGTCRGHDDLPVHHWGNSSLAIEQAERSVAECLSIARQRFHVNPEKIFVAGLGSGGTMALRVALRNPELFAGAASLGGSFPRGQRPLVAWSRLPGLKLFLGHGRDSRNYSVDQLCEDLRLFHTSRLAVAVRQYPVGDELRTPMLRDLDRWMMEIVTGQPSCPADVAETPALGTN